VTRTKKRGDRAPVDRLNRRLCVPEEDENRKSEPDEERDERRDQQTRELSQLMRIHERLLSQLQEARSELNTPATAEILAKLRSRIGTKPDVAFSQITAAVEEGIRCLMVFESEIKQELFSEDKEITVEGIPDLPPHLARFLAERANLNGFRYDVLHDPVRGWVIRWKEYTSLGTIRGSGQIFERPHAWLVE